MTHGITKQTVRSTVESLNDKAERLGWARTAVIAQAISSCFQSSNAYVTESMLEGLNSELTSDGDNLARFEHSTILCFLFWEF